MAASFWLVKLVNLRLPLKFAKGSLIGAAFVSLHACAYAIFQERI
jgi:hypothetical protein